MQINDKKKKKIEQKDKKQDKISNMQMINMITKYKQHSQATKIKIMLKYAFS